MEEAGTSEAGLHPTADRGPVDDASKSRPEAGREASDDDASDAPEAGRDDCSKDTAASQHAPTLSKNQQKKLKRQQAWDGRKEDRKRRRKEKRQDQQARKRAEWEAKVAEAEAEGLDPETFIKSAKRANRPKQLVPVTIIIDCDFEEYMRETELVSLSSQVTRSYSDNRTAEYQVHLFMSSWKGALKARFETVLNNNHSRWPHCHFTDADFVAASREARELMCSPGGGTLSELLQRRDGSAAPAPGPRDEVDTAPVADADETPTEPAVVYLTSDSPYTLDRLEPYTSYVVGGIVDRNREKGLCYKRARQRGLRTAKLPIGDYMVMASRQVLATNHVVEIMLRWLECGDWASAFAKVIPKRKGGRLKELGGDKSDKEDEEAASGHEEETQTDDLV